MTSQPAVNLSASAILDFLRANWDTLQAMGVQRMGLFGSYRRNEARADSDIDLLFQMDDMTFAKWMDVWNFLEDGLGHEIDLVPDQDLREEIRPDVMREVLYIG